MLAGVDGCKAGWVAVWRLDPTAALETKVFPDFPSLVAALPSPTIIAVDMPIGLPDFIHGSGRGPEQAVRPWLGARQSSVFSVPSRSAVYAETGMLTNQSEIIAAHKRASTIAQLTSNPPRKISIQAFMLFPKIREIDTNLRNDPALAERVFESHPEFAFTVLNANQPMSLPKKIKGKINRPGMDERKDLLMRCGIDRSFLDQKPPHGAGEDDFLDACAMLLIVERIATGKARPHPEPLQRDGFGLPVSIWA